MLAVTGYRSKIISELRALLPDGEEVVRIPDAGPSPIAERYVLCAGLLRPKTLNEQSLSEIGESLHVNLIRPLEICEDVLTRNDRARIVVLGSESGCAWSFDGVYASAKAALHKYVETKKLSRNQQLVCVAPSIIDDCAMTLERSDLDNLSRRRSEHPKGRFLTAAEVARLIHFCLYVDEGYLSGQVIRMNGGA
jgi:NAD(P)-dependent dehydrogenase (short-subunit alcohol dehydrogenase family)